jgi:hypothetical protein
MMYRAPIVLGLGMALKVGIGEDMVIHWINFGLIIEKDQGQDGRT